MSSTAPARRWTSALVAGAVALLVAAPAQASTASEGNAIIHECLLKDSVSGTHSNSAYQYALAHLPSDVTEYSDCGDVIRRAELAAAHGDTSGSEGGAFRDPYATASSAERRAIVSGQRTRPGPIRVGSSSIRPGLSSVAPAAVVNRLPGPLLAALGVILVPGVLLAARAGASVLQRRRAP